jgi:hypothetical protein
MIFTGDPEFLPFYRYQVEVTVKGTLFEPGRAWKGPWVAAAGNGPVTLTIPRPSDPGVTARSLPVLATAETDDRPRGEVHVTEAPASATNGAAERTANGLKSLI